jgi:hypothetical protein
MPFFDEVVIPSLKEDVDPSTIEVGFNEYVTKQNESFSKGLRENRDTILEEKKSLATQMKEVQEQYAFLEGKEFNADAYNKMNSDLESYKSSANKDEEEFRQQLTDQYEKGKKSYEETVTPTINSLNLKLEEAVKSRDTYQNQYKNYLKDSALRKAVSDIGADMDEWTFEGFKTSAKIDYDDGGGIKDISVKHDGGYIPIEDWSKIFPTTDRGKKMIKQPINGPGGGAKGSGSGTGGAVTLEDINNMEDAGARRVALAKYMEGKK